MLQFLKFSGIICLMLSGLFLMVSLFFGSFRVGARYMGDWLRSIAILLALGGFLVLIFTPVL